MFTNAWLFTVLPFIIPFCKEDLYHLSRKAVACITIDSIIFIIFFTDWFFSFFLLIFFLLIILLSQYSHKLCKIFALHYSASLSKSAKTSFVWGLQTFNGFFQSWWKSATKQGQPASQLWARRPLFPALFVVPGCFESSKLLSWISIH